MAIATFAPFLGEGGRGGGGEKGTARSAKTTAEMTVDRFLALRAYRLCRVQDRTQDLNMAIALVAVAPFLGEGGGRGGGGGEVSARTATVTAGMTVDRRQELHTRRFCRGRDRTLYLNMATATVAQVLGEGGGGGWSSARAANATAGTTVDQCIGFRTLRLCRVRDRAQDLNMATATTVVAPFLGEGGEGGVSAGTAKDATAAEATPVSEVLGLAEAGW